MESDNIYIVGLEIKAFMDLLGQVLFGALNSSRRLSAKLVADSTVEWRKVRKSGGICLFYRRVHCICQCGF